MSDQKNSPRAPWPQKPKRFPPLPDQVMYTMNTMDTNHPYPILHSLLLILSKLVYRLTSVTLIHRAVCATRKRGKKTITMITKLTSVSLILALSNAMQISKPVSTTGFRAGRAPPVSAVQCDICTLKSSAMRKWPKASVKCGMKKLCKFKDPGNGKTRRANCCVGTTSVNEPEYEGGPETTQTRRTCILQTERILNTVTTKKGKKGDLYFRETQLNIAKNICMACLTFCDVCQKYDTDRKLMAMSKCYFSFEHKGRQSCKTMKTTKTAMVCGDCVKAVYDNKENMKRSVCPKCTKRTDMMKVPQFQSMDKCGGCGKENKVLTACNYAKCDYKDSFVCKTKMGCDKCITKMPSGGRGKYMPVCSTCVPIFCPVWYYGYKDRNKPVCGPLSLAQIKEAIRRIGNITQVYTETLHKWISKEEFHKISPSDYTIIPAQNPATSDQPPNQALSQQPSTPPLAKGDFSYFVNDGDTVTNQTKEQVCEAYKEGKVGCVWMPGWDDWRETARYANPGEDLPEEFWHTRRRLANQSLIDRFIRESERCIAS